jgi:protein LSM14
VVIPNTDFDFDASNKKFNKEELAKEADLTENTGNEADDEANGDDDIVIPNAPGVYDKKKSFFDDISTELKDRDTKKTGGGQEFRTEERKKNYETFGQGSIDGGYRGGYRGRGGRGGGRGRGRGAPGNGYGMNRGRGGFRGYGDANQTFAS